MKDPKKLIHKHFCYRNLNKKGVWWSAKNTRTGLVEFREQRLILRNVKLKVSEAGRQRVLRDKRKNVHAGVEGEIISARQLSKFCSWIRVKYDPYTMDSFMYANGLELMKVTEADFVILNKNGLWISDKNYPPIGLTLKQISL